MVGSITAKDGINKGFFYASEKNSFWKLLDFVILSKTTRYSKYINEELFTELDNNFKKILLIISLAV